MGSAVTLTFTCACGAPVHVEAPEPAALPARAACRACGAETTLARERVTPDGGLAGCVACGHPELYRVKDFPRALGIGVVVVAAALAPATHYLSLAAAAGLDGLRYLVLPDAVRCYACEATHRRVARAPRHPRFDRTIEERLRYGERAVMGSPMRPGGTAGAPEPEH